ncbi:tyrosine-type recombinase/integrase [Acidobacteriota bacterium]
MPKGKNKTRYNFGYGAIYQRKTKQGKIRWYLDYRDGNGNRIQKVAPLATIKEEAVVALKVEVQKAFDRKRGIEREKQNVKLREFTDLFIENYSKVNKRSWKDDQYRLYRLIDFFGNICLREITPLEIEKFKSMKINEGRAKATVNTYLKILKRMFNIAIDWGYAKDNPARCVKLYSEKDCLKERILSREEEERLLEAASEHLSPILIVALNTGMRRGEILNLKWSQVNFEKGEIRVVKTKSGSPRIVDMNSRLATVLLQLRNVNGGSSSVFINPKTGEPFTTVRRSFEAACKRADIQGLRFHDLRHTFASRLIEKGVDIIKVKELLGHSSVKVTERYTHSNREERKKAVELLCEKPRKRVRKSVNLLHNRYTEETDKAIVSISSLFSVN